MNFKIIVIFIKLLTRAVLLRTFENRVTFKIKKGYALELLTPETMKLLGSTKNKITEDKKW